MNRSAFKEQDYDEKIQKTVPFYRDMLQQVTELVNQMGREKLRWLDTGCGTGNMAETAVTQCSVAEMTLADPSEEMLAIAAKRAAAWNTVTRLIPAPTEKLEFTDSFEVVTAIQAHHYLDKERRKEAVKQCFRALKTGGVFVTYENIMPRSETGKRLALEIWKSYQIAHGIEETEAKSHISRFGTAYFPITAEEHLTLLKECGFRAVEILWYSHLQAGFYGVK